MAITKYHDLVVKHEAQVLALRDQIDSLKEQLRIAQADAETLRLLGTQYIGFHNYWQWNLELDQQLPLLRPAIWYLMWTLICLKAPNSQLTNPSITPTQFFGHSPPPRLTAMFFR